MKQVQVSVISMLTAFALSAAAGGLNAQGPTPSQTPGQTPGTALGQTAETPRTTEANAEAGFVRDAAAGAMKEVALGRIAARQASNADVKAFGSRMVTDHTTANNELMSLAKKKGITVPASTTHKMDMDRLSKLSGDAFDRAYIQGQVADHEKALALFETEAKSGADPDVKAWAAKTLPTLREHLQMVKDLHGRMDPTGRR